MLLYPPSIFTQFFFFREQFQALRTPWGGEPRVRPSQYARAAGRVCWCKGGNCAWSTAFSGRRCFPSLCPSQGRGTWPWAQVFPSSPTWLLREGLVRGHQLHTSLQGPLFSPRTRKPFHSWWFNRWFSSSGGLTTLSQLVVQQVIQQLWGSHHPLTAGGSTGDSAALGVSPPATLPSTHLPTRPCDLARGLDCRPRVFGNHATSSLTVTPTLWSVLFRCQACSLVQR